MGVILMLPLLERECGKDSDLKNTLALQLAIYLAQFAPLSLAVHRMLDEYFLIVRQRLRRVWAVLRGCCWYGLSREPPPSFLRWRP